MKDKFLRFLSIAKKAGTLIEGYNKCEIAIKSSKVYLAIIADELSPNSKKKFTKYCSDKGIEVIQGVSQEELSLCLGSGNLKIVCVNDKSMSENLLALWKKIILDD
jgi:ribosomal protein L7Ae-like RNA K-turn-binding protein